jgi:tRNA 2-thiouridine synthesizing protein E
MAKLELVAPKTFKYGSRSYTLDRHGFLDPPSQWDDNFADGMARELGITGGLTASHWKLLKYLRQKFLLEEQVPVVVQACADNGLRLSRLRRLFPTGYHRGACKIAGINYEFMYRTNIWLTYEGYRILRKKHELTAAGFLKNFDRWNEDFAELAAKEWDLPEGITESHREVIRFLRDFFRKTGSIPTVYETCKQAGVCLNELRSLFPGGYRRGACRMAGLPFFA